MTPPPILESPEQQRKDAEHLKLLSIFHFILGGHWRLFSRRWCRAKCFIPLLAPTAAPSMADGVAGKDDDGKDSKRSFKGHNGMMM